MSQENVEIVRRCAQAMNLRDLSAELPPALLDLVDPGVEVDLSRNVFNPDVYRGHSGVERWRIALIDVWESFHGELEELVDAGDKVVTAMMMRGKGKGSGVDVAMRVFQVWTVRNSKVLRIVGGYRDRAEALEAVGLSEQDARRLLSLGDTARAMSQANVQLVRAAIDAANTDGVDALLKLVAPDFEYDVSRAVGPFRGVYSTDELPRVWEEFAGVWGSFRYEADEFIETGKQVVTPFTN